MTPTEFVEALSQVHMRSVFNPYSDRCQIFDREDAAQIRRRNLIALLKASKELGVHSLWIGRDLGYKGGRRTGIPLTDEIHLPKIGDAFGVRLSQATSGPPVSERTATFVWQVIRSLPQYIFFWNVFPFHPYEPGHPLSNRCHTREERENCQEFLLQVLEMLKPKQVVAIGRDAEIALHRLSISFTTVRHPSYGGQSAFVEGMEQLYNVSLQARTESMFDLTNDMPSCTP